MIKCTTLYRALTESNPPIAGMTKLVTQNKADGHGAECKETGNVEVLDGTVAVEDEVEPRDMRRDDQHDDSTVV